ncbi:unnamed protein product [Chrysoparadoxa australica]
MSAINVVNTLRKKNREGAEKGDGNFPVDYQWGTLEVLHGRDTLTFGRQELRNHLQARDLPSTGNKRQLAERLEKSILEEQARTHADAEDAEFELNADLEERGSVYVVGTNSSGQLGVGDLEHRPYFTVVHETRGIGVCSVEAGYDMAFAITEDHDVLVWGGKGVGPMGKQVDPEDSDDPDGYLEPKHIRELVGEELVMAVPGAGHAIGASRGGDAYVWGQGDSGQLGVGDFAAHHTPTLVNGLHEGAAVCQVAAGENHTFALTTDGDLYSWGHGREGRLGIGSSYRAGVPKREAGFFPTPMLMHVFAKEMVRQVATGPTFALAITDTGLWSWGSGDGGVLGQGDVTKRESPSQIETFRGMHVLQVSCGTWHAAAVVLVPPCLDCGYVYTWGSGYHGQLGQENKLVSLKPALVSNLLKTQQFIASICCGSHHNAALTAEGELYTWGSNRNGCLGRTLPQGSPFTSEPGHVGGFGVLVDGIGRGLPRSFSCGKEFTIVCTYPYEGPIMSVAKEIMQEYATEDEEILLQEQELARLEAEEREEDLARKAETAALTLALANQVRLCSLCDDCPGFKSDPLRESVCGVCQHSVSFHTRSSDGSQTNLNASSALSKR